MLYKDGDSYINVGEAQAGVTRALGWIDNLGVFQGIIGENQAAYRFSGTQHYVIRAYQQSGTVWYIGFDTAVSGGGGGTGDAPPHGDPLP